MAPDSSTLEWALPRADGRPNDGPKRWRRGGGIWLFYLLNPLGQAWSHHSLLASIVGTALLVAFSVAYLFLVPRGWWWREGKRYGVQITAVMFGLAVAETAVIGVQGLTAMIFVAVSGVMLLGTRSAVVFAGVLAGGSAVIPQYIGPWHVQGVQWSDGASVVLAGLAVYGFSRLIRANHELAAARNEVAVLAAERERARIARDMHDLLGHSLTTITVKAALASRLVDSDPTHARAEMQDVERLAREALADVRATVSGFRDVRLSSELVNARQVLEAAGIRAELPGAVDNVEGDLATLFGWVLREGVTNVVRHSRASRVTVTVEPRAIEIIDDGQCPGEPGSLVLQGNGLSGIAERVASAGGSMAVGPWTPRGYRLRVEVPT